MRWLYKGVDPGSGVQSWDLITPPAPPRPAPGVVSVYDVATFVADPYDPNVVYVDDVGGQRGAGIKVTLDGGRTWQFDRRLDTLIRAKDTGAPYTNGGRCATRGTRQNNSVLADVAFSPTNQSLRVAAGCTGAYVNTSATSTSMGNWRRLYADVEIPCNASSVAVDDRASPISVHVFCYGRGVLRLANVF